MIISFGMTAEAIRARVKTVTRRDWAVSHAHKFHAGDLCKAYDKSPRVGGTQIATIRLTVDPYIELVSDARLEDFDREGFAWMAEHGLTLKGLTPEEFWSRLEGDDPELWVVRFDYVG